MESGTNLLGNFEELLMLAVGELKENAYGVPIHAAVSKAVGRTVALGAVYNTLDRLVSKGLLETWLGEATDERGGRAKRYFRITGAGAHALRETQLARERLNAGAWRPQLNMGWTF